MRRDRHVTFAKVAVVESRDVTKALIGKFWLAPSVAAHRKMKWSISGTDRPLRKCRKRFDDRFFFSLTYLYL